MPLELVPIDLENHPDVLDIIVKCPVPGQEHQPEQRLGDFIGTEKGQEFMGQVLESAGVLVKLGLSEADAVVGTLGIAIVRDQEGNPVRASQAELPVVVTGQLTESKKK